MKIVLNMFAALICVATFTAPRANALEGRILGKLAGELDPFVLGDGCLTVLEFYDGWQNRLERIAVYEKRLKVRNCLSVGADRNMRVEFDPGELKIIENPRVTDAMKHIVRQVMRVKGVQSYWQR